MSEKEIARSTPVLQFGYSRKLNMREVDCRREGDFCWKTICGSKMECQINQKIKRKTNLLIKFNTLMHDL